MSANEDLESACLILETMLELRQADEQSVSAAMRLVRSALAELGDKPPPDDAADDDEGRPQDATTRELRERFPGIDDDAKARAMDLQFGIAALDTNSTEYANAIQVLGAHRYGDK